MPHEKKKHRVAKVPEFLHGSKTWPGVLRRAEHAGYAGGKDNSTENVCSFPYQGAISRESFKAMDISEQGQGLQSLLLLVIAGSGKDKFAGA
jgi:hypothetical protein